MRNAHPPGRADRRRGRRGHPAGRLRPVRRRRSAGRPGDRSPGHDHAGRDSLGAADGDDRRRPRARRCPAWWPAPPGRTRTSGSCRRGRRPATIVASDSPAPTAIVIPGPAAGSGWRPDGLPDGAVRQAAEGLAGQARRGGAGRGRADARGGLGLAGRAWTSRRSSAGWPIRPADQGGLAAESAVAASALAGLEEEAGNIFGHHRVIVLFCDDLSGALPAGELTGDDVIVVTGYLPTAAAPARPRPTCWRPGRRRPPWWGRR